ncbi:hypothetical protein XH94_06285 [Bradyrhizobium zhanjiangense]|uniref:Uncharacterized protein n=1 Tax=Bradyrhizobium zhanjiangense TaxID=1325107 RepID=A0A4Q0SU73_9BRAD|nr:hypothetical protein XH94_06285 [Bradyrhizobium zhanjiangense]
MLNATFSQATQRTKEATIRVADLTTASSKIGEVITIIKKTAEQTDLPALMPQSRPLKQATPAKDLPLLP